MRIAGLSGWLERRAVKRQMSAELHERLEPVIAAMRSAEPVPAAGSHIFLVYDEMRRQRIRWMWGAIIAVGAVSAYCTYGTYW